MTVKELIEELKKFNGDVEVVAHVDGQDADYPIDPKPSIYGSACLSRFGGGWQVFAKEGVISLNVSQKPSDQIVWSEPGRSCDCGQPCDQNGVAMLDQSEECQPGCFGHRCAYGCGTCFGPCHDEDK